LNVKFYDKSYVYKSFLSFVFPRGAILAQYILLSCVCLFVCHKPVLYQNHHTVRAGCGMEAVSLFFLSLSFCAVKRIRSLLQCIITKFGYQQNLGYSFMELCPELWTWTISPLQVDRVVNKTRRQSSLLTTLTTVDSSWLDAL